MIAYVLSAADLTVRDTFTVSDFSIIDSTVSGEPSQVVIYRKPKAAEGDYIVLHDNGQIRTGIINGITNNKGEQKHTLTVEQMQTMFNRKIVIGNSALLSSTGIEDFIASEITANWISSSDTFLNVPYLSVTATTHNPIPLLPVTEDGGIYNLLEYIEAALPNYGIFVEFTFSPTGIAVTVSKKSQTALDIDATLPNVYELNEVYEVDALAKLTVRWNAGGDSGYYQSYNFYLKTDGTITTDATDPERAKGRIDCISSSTETIEEMTQQAVDTFTQNSYQHRINFKMIPNGLAPGTEFYAGRTVRVKTGTGIKETIITRVARDRTNTLDVTLGNLKVTLLEKLRGGRS